MSDKEPTTEVVPSLESEEDSDEELPEEVEKALRDPFNKIAKAAAGVNGFYFLYFGKAYTKHTKVEDITKEYVLGLPHLLLDLKLVKPAFEFYDDISQHEWECPYGGTTMNNEIWYDFMLPEVAKTLKLLSKKQWSKGLTGLLKMYVFMVKNDGYWIHDQDIYTDETIFSSFFKNYSKAWRMLLKQSDEVIGLKHPGGLPGGYRENLLDMLRKQQDDNNNGVLKSFAEDFELDEAKLDMVTKNKKPSEVNLENKAFLSGNKENESGESSKSGTSKRGAKRGVTEVELHPTRILKAKDGKLVGV